MGYVPQLKFKVCLSLRHLGCHGFSLGRSYCLGKCRKHGRPLWLVGGSENLGKDTTRWRELKYVLFSPLIIWGKKVPIWRADFSHGLKPPTRQKSVPKRIISTPFFWGDGGLLGGSEVFFVFFVSRISRIYFWVLVSNIFCSPLFGEKVHFD